MAKRKQAGVQESSGPLLANACEPIRIGCESHPACLLGQWQPLAKATPKRVPSKRARRGTVCGACFCVSSDYGVPGSAACCWHQSCRFLSRWRGIWLTRSVCSNGGDVYTDRLLLVVRRNSRTVNYSVISGCVLLYGRVTTVQSRVTVRKTNGVTLFSQSVVACSFLLIFWQ